MDQDKVIAVDFNRTLVAEGGPDPSQWGEPTQGAVEAMQRLQDAGFHIAINSVVGDTVALADWLRRHDVPFDGINESPAQPDGSNPHKINAVAYIDDRAVPYRGNWEETLADLFDSGVLTKRRKSVKKSLSWQATPRGFAADGDRAKYEITRAGNYWNCKADGSTFAIVDSPDKAKRRCEDADFNPLKRKDALPGGLADDADPTQFDPSQLQAGTQVELEHTDDPALAAEIAMDHLAEDPAYYDKLEQVEGEGRLPLDGDGWMGDLADKGMFDSLFTPQPYSVGQFGGRWYVTQAGAPIVTSPHYATREEAVAEAQRLGGKEGVRVAASRSKGLRRRKAAERLAKGLLGDVARKVARAVLGAGGAVGSTAWEMGVTMDVLPELQHVAGNDALQEAKAVFAKILHASVVASGALAGSAAGPAGAIGGAAAGELAHRIGGMVADKLGRAIGVKRRSKGLHSPSPMKYKVGDRVKTEVGSGVVVRIAGGGRTDHFDVSAPKEYVVKLDPDAKYGWGGREMNFDQYDIEAGASKSYGSLLSDPDFQVLVDLHRHDLDMIPSAMAVRQILAQRHGMNVAAVDAHAAVRKRLDKNKSAMLVNIGFVLGTGRANRDTEEAIMRFMGTEDDLQELIRKLKAADEETLKEVLRIINKHQPGALPVSAMNDIKAKGMQLRSALEELTQNQLRGLYGRYGSGRVSDAAAMVEELQGEPRVSTVMFGVPGKGKGD